MLKKAGMVVLGATAGMISLAPLASAGEAHSHGGDHGNHGQHESRAGDCGAQRRDSHDLRNCAAGLSRACHP